MNKTKMSKFISLILRHHPEVIGISLDAHGWANVHDLLAGINADSYRFITMPMLEDIVASDEKGRYSFNADHTKIRANYGHSLPIDLELEAGIPPKILYHGTAQKSVASISKQGLLPMERLYVRGRTIVNLFLEPSTRTKSSFELAEKRLSADSLSMGGSTSSVVKGESLADTIQTIDAMNVDMFICRARLAGTPQKITENTDAVVINAGDGKHQHPTQAMLDLYTIRKHFGHLDGLKVAIVGDLAHSRVCGSLAPALRTMGAEVTLVGPPTFQVDDPDWFGCPQTWSLDEVIDSVDVVYMLRVQLERMEGATIPSRREYNRLYGLDMKRVSRMKDNAIICHPGPMNRGMEINADVADCARSRILDQVNAGVLTRMAEMYLLLGGENNGISA